MTRMLASVRDLAEAMLCAACGADWLDLKEPAGGALGAVSYATAQSVAARFRAVLPVSATVGDCWDTPELIPALAVAMAATGVAYLKVGIYARRPRPALLAALTAAVRPARQVIAVCAAEAPPDGHDIRALARTGIRGVMLDTARKGGRNLLALMSAAQLDDFVACARGEGLITGLAGCLSAQDIPQLVRHGPDFLGFRGALCAHGARAAAAEREAVVRVREALNECLFPAAAL